MQQKLRALLEKCYPWKLLNNWKKKLFPHSFFTSIISWEFISSCSTPRGLSKETSGSQSVRLFLFSYKIAFHQKLKEKLRMEKYAVRIFFKQLKVKCRNPNFCFTVLLNELHRCSFHWKMKLLRVNFKKLCHVLKRFWFSSLLNDDANIFFRSFLKLIKVSQSFVTKKKQTFFLS